VEMRPNDLLYSWKIGHRGSLRQIDDFHPATDAIKTDLGILLLVVMKT